MNTFRLALAGTVALLAACGGGNDARPVANQAPELSAIAAQEIVANSDSAPIGFTIADETLAAIAVSASSDLPALLPDDGLAISGQQASRSLVITPTGDMTGVATVTINATDPLGRTGTTSFLVTVTAEQRSMQQFARDVFASSDDAPPVPINAVEFVQDADDDDFADLIGQ